jgi:hypothetical protein
VVAVWLKRKTNDCTNFEGLEWASATIRLIGRMRREHLDEIESSDGFATTCESWTAGVTQRFNELISTRPEVRNEYAYQRAAVGQEAKKTSIAGWCR